MLSLWQLYAVAFAVGCITVFFDVANQSYLPELVDAEQIAEGNARLQASQQTAGVAGPCGPISDSSDATQHTNRVRGCAR